MATPIEVKDILPLEAYEQVRADYRKTLMAVKKDRRLHVGDKVTLLFENRKTVLYQVQEMCRAEKITSRPGIQAEIDVYSELLPEPDALSATLLIEIPDQTIARAELDRLVGIDEAVTLHVGDHASKAFFEPGHMTKVRVSAVQYVRFKLDEAARAALRDASVTAKVAIDHPAYQAEAEIPASVRAALIEDLDAAAK